MEETKKTRTRTPKVSPHVFVWGSCFWFCTPACFLLPLPAACHTQLAHTQLVHTPLTHTQFVHIQLAHTLLAPTQFVYKQLTHTQLVNTQLAHTQLAHTPLTHTQLPHTHIQLLHWRHRPSLCEALMALDWLFWGKPNSKYHCGYSHIQNQVNSSYHGELQNGGNTLIVQIRTYIHITIHTYIVTG